MIIIISIRTRLLSAVVAVMMSVGSQLVTEITSVSVQGLYEPVQADVECVARVLWHECRGMESKAEQAAVVWCILNRVDSDRWANDIQSVCKEPNQFAYRSDAPLDPELVWLAEDVITRWNMENDRWDDVGRTLPWDYYFFSGYNGRNWFRKEYKSNDKWDWSLPDPYAEGDTDEADRR